jgi:hypothetical protein
MMLEVIPSKQRNNVGVFFEHSITYLFSRIILEQRYGKLKGQFDGNESHSKQVEKQRVELPFNNRLFILFI